MHGRFDSELADGVENEIHAQAALVEWLGGFEHGFEVGFGDLLAQDHDADGEGDFSVDNALGQKLLAEVVRDQGVVARFTEKRGDPFEDFEELVEVLVGIFLADFRFGEDHAVRAGERADGRRLDRAFQVQV